MHDFVDLALACLALAQALLIALLVLPRQEYRGEPPSDELLSRIPRTLAEVAVHVDGAIIEVGDGEAGVQVVGDGAEARLRFAKDGFAGWALAGAHGAEYPALRQARRDDVGIDRRAVGAHQAPHGDCRPVAHDVRGADRVLSEVGRVHQRDDGAPDQRVRRRADHLGKGAIDADDVQRSVDDDQAVGGEVEESLEIGRCHAAE